jgi:hypothetical protein
MKLYTRLTLITLMLILVISFPSQAQTTYNVTTNTSWTTAGYPNCNTCTFNITPGVTLTIDKNANCTKCTFSGGTVNITSNFGFFTNVLFQNDTLLINKATTFQNPTFTNDSIAVNFATSFQSSGTFTGSRVLWAAANTCQACSFTNDTMSMGSFAMNLQNSTTNFTNTVFTVTGTGNITSTSGMAFTNSDFTLSGTGYIFANGGTTTISGSQVNLNGNTYFQANSGPVILENHSEMIAGDGSAASTAHVYINAGGGGLKVYDNSMIGNAGSSNYYRNNNAYSYIDASGTTTSYNTSANTVSCGGGYPHACSANFVYGCSTLNKVGALGCTVLAIASPDFSATPAGAGKVALSWSEPSNANLAGFKVERSADGTDWADIASFEGGLYATGVYHYNDPSAPAGTNYYRLQMTDKDGRITWSKVITVNVLATMSETGISIFPNPSANRRFFVRTSSAEETIVNMYTLSGQLLISSRLKGQMQYPVELPQSVQTGSLVAVQVIFHGKTQAFTLAIR